MFRIFFRFLYLFSQKTNKNVSRKSFIKTLLDSIWYSLSFSVHNTPSYFYDLILGWRVPSHDRWNELKPVWDFISVENLTSVSSQLFTCVHMNWGEMKLKMVWILYRSFWPKWNFKPAGDFHLNISADSLDVAFNTHVRLKLIVGMDFISVILTEMKFHFGW